jgi:hypothetical protein
MKMVERLIQIGPKQAFQEEIIKCAVLLVILAVILPLVLR